LGLPPPKIIVSRREWRREIGTIGAFVRWRRYHQRLWGRYAALWRWRRRREDYERLVYHIRRRWHYIRRERELRRVLARKVIIPYWRVGVAYMFEKEIRRPPYYFYAEFRKFVFTRTPEKYAIYDERVGEFTRPKPWLEEELREIMFASSLLSRRTKAGAIAHAEWVEALVDMKVFPFPDFECSAIDEKEVEAPLDTQQYYVRIQKTKAEIYEYKTAEVEAWLRSYRRWIRDMAERRLIRYPERYMRTVRQTTLDDFVRWWRTVKKFRREER